MAVSIRTIMMTFIVAIVGLALTPTIQSMVLGVTGSGGDNLTGSALALMGLFPLFWTILMIAIPVVALYKYFKGE